MARGPEGEGVAAPPRRGGAGWLSKLRPGVRKAEAPRANEGPDDLWVKCPDTGELIFRSDLEAALFVTPSGFHMRVTPEQRFRYTFDDGRFERLPAPKAVDDPLGFVDQKPYVQRLAAARETTGDFDAVSIGVGTVGGVECVLMVQNFAFLGGSLGMSAGDGFIAAARGGGRPRRAPRRRHGLRRRAYAGGRPQLDADGAHHPRDRGAEGGRPSLRRGAHRPDDGRRDRVLRHARRRPTRRAGSADRLHRPPHHRTNHP